MQQACSVNHSGHFFALMDDDDDVNPQDLNAGLKSGVVFQGFEAGSRHRGSVALL